MSTADATIPSQTVGRPVRELYVSVVRGPDAGASVTVEDGTVTIGSAEGNTLVLHDRTVSRFHAEIARRGDRALVTDLGSTNGIAIGPVRLDGAAATIAPGTRLMLGNSEIEVADGRTVVVQQAVWTELGAIRGRSEPMQRLMDLVAQLAGSTAPALLIGESGTGKELVARALHDLGPRASEAFVTVDCGAIPPTLFASELFGHERGAFTGAMRAHVGAIERANGGTLFLDEIGELPAEQQAALLGVLERRRIRRVGGSVEIPVDVRLVSATHRDLRAAVNEDAFRLDLYYRVAVVLVALPPLRERTGDIPLLVEHFLAEEGWAAPMETLFPRDVMKRLEAHRWPGNVRELRNVVAAAVATGGAAQVDAPVAPIPSSGDAIASVLDADYKTARKVVTDAFEQRYLARLLERAGGSVRAAARLAGIDRTYLSNLLKRHGIR